MKSSQVVLVACSIFVSLVGLIHSPSVFANDSGCGLGSIIIQKNSKGLQLLSMTTNHTFLSQPLGITFGTSGCSSSGIVENEKAIDTFVAENQSEIKTDLARGSGQHFETLSGLYGCSSEQAKEEFLSLARQDLGGLKKSFVQNEMLLRLCGQQVASKN